MSKIVFMIAAAAALVLFTGTAEAQASGYNKYCEEGANGKKGAKGTHPGTTDDWFFPVPDGYPDTIKTIEYPHIHCGKTYFALSVGGSEKIKIVPNTGETPTKDICISRLTTAKTKPISADIRAVLDKFAANKECENVTAGTGK